MTKKMLTEKDKERYVEFIREGDYNCIEDMNTVYEVSIADHNKMVAEADKLGRY